VPFTLIRKVFTKRKKRSTFLIQLPLIEEIVESGMIPKIVSGRVLAGPPTKLTLLQRLN
jgi:hypothetical protein